MANLFKTTKRSSSVFLTALLGLMLLAAPASAQRSRGSSGPDRTIAKDSDGVKAAFREATNPVSRGTVIIRSDDKQVALGAVVAADGWIITKASELVGERITVVADNGGKPLKATLVGVSDPHDLAMLKVDASGLTAVEWNDGKAEVGEWVASTGPTATPVAVGVVSVGRRKIPGRSGMLGVGLTDAEGGARIMQVIPESPAEKVGIKVDDVIIKVNGVAVASREALVDAVRKFSPGQEVTVTVKRGERVFDATTRLMSGSGGSARAEVMNRMGGSLSNRSTNFPAVFQHDTVLKPEQVGGPLVNLDGKAIGINIARAGRTESYALPADVIKPLLTELKSGRLAPTTKPASDKDE